jgi:hypothetical protein
VTIAGTPQTHRSSVSFPAHEADGSQPARRVMALKRATVAGLTAFITANLLDRCTPAGTVGRLAGRGQAARLPAIPAVSSPAKARPDPSSDRPVISNGRLGSPVKSLRDVQDAARHADPRTTRRYDKNRNSLNRHPTHRLLGALEP